MASNASNSTSESVLEPQGLRIVRIVFSVGIMVLGKINICSSARANLFAQFTWER